MAMAEPAKPFACTMPDCGMSFTNEDHLHVHTKKHDMVLQLGLEQKSTFVADQTPTPTRFIRNCEEMGLFQDLQNVAANPFDEGFKRAMEAKHGILSLEPAMASSDDVLHTPQMVFPLLDSAESTLYTNNQRNITISRSSSDESGTIKEFETRTISKLTNEVTTISRIVNADDVTIKQTDIQKDVETVSYKNNIIKIASNKMRKEDGVPVVIYTDTVIKEATNVNRDVTIDTNKLQVDKVPNNPIMSQKSIDIIVDSFTSELGSNVEHTVVTNEKSKTIDITNKIEDNAPSLIKQVIKTRKRQPKLMPKKAEEIKVEPEDDYEVVIKLPNGKTVVLKPVEEKIDAKQVLRNSLTKKVTQDPVKKVLNIKPSTPVIPNIVKIPSGTLIPVTLVNHQGTPLTNEDLNKVPIAKIANVDEIVKLNVNNISVPVNVPINNIINIPNVTNNITKIVNINPIQSDKVNEIHTLASTGVLPVTNGTNAIKISNPYHVESNTDKRKFEQEKVLDCNTKENGHGADSSDDCLLVGNVNNEPKRRRFDLVGRKAASKRYRDKLREAMQRQSEENKLLKEANQKLISEKALLKSIILEHMKKCTNKNDLISKMNEMNVNTYYRINGLDSYLKACDWSNCEESRSSIDQEAGRARRTAQPDNK